MSPSSFKADPRLYAALDVANINLARKLVDELGAHIQSYKIGLQLLPIGGMDLARDLKAQGKHVFLDFKLHDIGATVEKATRSIAPLGADLLTVHARPEVMAAAHRGREGTDLKILGVTVLTSLDKAALEEIGYGDSAKDLVMKRVDQAMRAGIDGVVASPLEAEHIRARVDDDFLIVTPGIRLADGDKGDQKRIATPDMAIKKGASHIVVGRPIHQATNPVIAAKTITDLMKNS